MLCSHRLQLHQDVALLPLSTWCVSASLLVALFISLKLGTALGIDSYPALVSKGTEISHQKSTLIPHMNSECADK
jgi:hypothetical protein